MPKKTLYFDYFCGYYVSAEAEDGKITEFNFEKRNTDCAVGDIYFGRVESVLPGMNAAFVNCGLKKNCYLSTDDGLPDGDKYHIVAAAEPERTELKKGDLLPVQIVKVPSGSKGAKVSARLTFVGQNLIYMPDCPFVGVSRKISDDELKSNLIFSAKKLLKEGSPEGIVARTAAPYAKRKELEQELDLLRKFHTGITKACETAGVGDLLYSDFALPLRVLRDTLYKDIDSVVVGNAKLLEYIESIVGLYPPRTRKPVYLHSSNRDMMDELGLSRQFLGIISPKVELENGGYIVIEHTEALTVIDVNTGRFTGEDNLEQTVYYTNILAAREIARQVRLRNIGGIVVVDFIDMQSESHRKAIAEELERALKGDRAKCSVLPMSKLGLVEFTRKRVGVSPLSLMVKPCKHCAGSGHTCTPEFIIIGLRAKLLNMFADGAKDIRVDMNNEVLSRLLGWKEMREDIRAHAGENKVFAVPHRTYHEEQMAIKTAPFNVPYDGVEI